MASAAASWRDPKSVTATVTGPKMFALKVMGKLASNLQGEIMGIISALMVASANANNLTIFTDHLNSTQLLDDAQSKLGSVWKLQNMNSQPYYQWAISLATTETNKVIYTPGHSDKKTSASILNNEADHWAAGSKEHTHLLPTPEPTFSMDQYTFFSDKDRWIELNIQEYVIDLDARDMASCLQIDKKREW